MAGGGGAKTGAGDLEDATAADVVVGVAEGVATGTAATLTTATVVLLVVVGVVTGGVAVGMAMAAASLTPGTRGSRGSMAATGLDALLDEELRGLERVRARNGDPGAWNGDSRAWNGDPAVPLVSRLLISSSMEMVRSSQKDDNMATNFSSPALSPPPPLPPFPPSGAGGGLDWSEVDLVANWGLEGDTICPPLEGLAGVVMEGPL